MEVKTPSDMLNNTFTNHIITFTPRSRSDIRLPPNWPPQDVLAFANWTRRKDSKCESRCSSTIVDAIVKGTTIEDNGSSGLLLLNSGVSATLDMTEFSIERCKELWDKYGPASKNSPFTPPDEPETICFPLCRDEHWVVVFVQKAEKKSIVYDTLDLGLEVWEAFMRKAVAWIVGNGYINTESQLNDWKFVSKDGVKKQTDVVSCGFLVCMRLMFAVDKQDMDEIIVRPKRPREICGRSTLAKLFVELLLKRFNISVQQC